MVNVLYTESVLRSESCRSSHCITTMGSNNLLVSFKTTEKILSV